MGRGPILTYVYTTNYIKTNVMDIKDMDDYVGLVCSPDPDDFDLEEYLERKDIMVSRNPVISTTIAEVFLGDTSIEVLVGYEFYSAEPPVNAGPIEDQYPGTDAGVHIQKVCIYEPPENDRDIFDYLSNEDVERIKQQIIDEETGDE